MMKNNKIENRCVLSMAIFCCELKKEITMEIKINKEIKDYHESMFFGLSARQFICSVLAVGVAVGTYFGLRDIVGKEMVSWM